MLGPGRPDRAIPDSDHINAMEKLVASRSLTEPERANTTVISDDVVGETPSGARSPEARIVQYGFGEVLRRWRPPVR